MKIYPGILRVGLLYAATGVFTGNSSALGEDAGSSIPLEKVPDLILSRLPKQDVYRDLTSPLLHTLLQSDQTNALLGFINDWHLTPQFFNSQNGSSGDAVLGLTYDYSKSAANRAINEQGAYPLGASFTLNAKGSVAADAKKNPNNFLESGVTLHFFQGLGGIDPTYQATPEAGAVLTKLTMAATSDKQLEAALIRQQFTPYMRPQFFWDLQGHGTFESDQEFHNKQWVYGGKLGLVFRDWRDNSNVGWFNLLDYPFAVVRWMTKTDQEFRPSGRTFPSAVIGMDLVDPSSDNSRLKIDPQKGAYPRLRAEVAFKTPLLKWDKDCLYVSATYRHFQEVGASSLIKSAGMDYSDYFVVRLDLPYNFNLSYSTGRLPLDHKDDQVYAIGWKLNF